MLLVLTLSNVIRRAGNVAGWALGILVLAACGSDAVEPAQVASATPTPVVTTAPLVVPTEIPVPAPTPTLPPPEPTANPTPAATVAPEPSPTTATEDATAAPSTATATAVPEIVETPTPAPTPTIAPEEAAAGSPEVEPEPTSPPVEPTPTAPVVAARESPMECYDRDAGLPRAFVEGVDALSFEGGRVYCAPAGTNTLAVARSYRHASGLVVQRNGDFLLDASGTGYVPYSGSLHFCLDGQPSSAPFRADTLLALFVVIDDEALLQLGQGASAPAGFTTAGAQCGGRNATEEGPSQ